MTAPADLLLERMRKAGEPMPVVRDVTAAYAQQVAVLADKLSPRELDILVLLGGMIHRRVSRTVPVLREDQIDAWVAGPGRIQ